MDELEIITTADGSHSLLNKNLNETYHSTHGAIRESIHVFIQSGLNFLYERNLRALSIFEVGFGTGLNALLTFGRAHSLGLTIDYTSVEAFPLDLAIIDRLNYPAELNVQDTEDFFGRIHAAKWNAVEALDARISLYKIHARLEELEVEQEKYDLIYFDAFAPSKQPLMWELPLLQKVVQGMKPGGVFVTYCAKGQVKRDLAALGLTVETLDGPPGKKEMIRAQKKSLFLPD